MSVSDIDISKVFKILGLGCLVAVLAFVGLWSAGLDWLPAIKGGVGVGIGWTAGNLADCGMIMPNITGLRK
jgi:hypothetical protein